MSKSTLARSWVQNLHGLRKDERGAESSEVILVLVLLVIGLTFVWWKLKNAISGKADDTVDCLNGANDKATAEACS